MCETMRETLLKQLYNGDLHPAENIGIESDELKKSSKLAANAREDFTKRLSKNDWAVFQELMELQSKNSAVYSYESFAYGFRLAVGLMSESFPKFVQTDEMIMK